MFNSIYTLLFILGIPTFIFMFYNVGVGIKGYLCRYHHYKHHEPTKRFCAVVAARNEEGVIGQLVDTLKSAKYPEELLDVWVIPNNCTDKTGDVAREHGAHVYDPVREIHSKGEALNEFFDYTLTQNDNYDAFCVFDADNLVDPNYFQVMNDAMHEDVEIAQGYRDAKNPKDSWVSGSQSIFYYVINRFMNESKARIGLSAVLNGTGFMVSRDIINEMGFNTFSLTEDIEFSTQNILKGRKIAFIPDAITYDEHPTDQKTSIKQRRRWSTGTIQVLYEYAPKLWQRFKETKEFTCFDMIIYLLSPYMQVISTIYTIATFIIYGSITLFQGYLTSNFAFTLLISVGSFLLCILYTMFTIKVENHKLSEVNTASFFAFWYFLMSWVVINFVVFFKPTTTWEPIQHQKAIDFAELKKGMEVA